MIYESDYGNTMEIEITKLLLKNKFPILKRKYNWFADYEIANLRAEVLKIFKKTHNLYKNIESSQTQVDDYPQREFNDFYS